MRRRPIALVLAAAAFALAQAAGDLRDLPLLERLSGRFDAARAAGDTASIADVDAAVRRAAAREPEARLARTRETVRAWASLAGRYDAKSLDARRRILDALLASARAETREVGR